jgi:hypothetical protein
MRGDIIRIGYHFSPVVKTAVYSTPPFQGFHWQMNGPCGIFGEFFNKKNVSNKGTKKESCIFPSPLTEFP